jgi:hypothetical protein
VPAKIPVRMTVDQFLKWDSEDGRRYELVNGEPRAGADEGDFTASCRMNSADSLAITCAIRQLAAKWLLILASFLGFCPSIMSGFRT